jgi:putative glutathione S-transferase
MGDEGWTFDEGDDVIADSVNHKARLHEVYTQADPEYSGRVTVPVLWDKERNTIVSNESSEIIRMFNSAFDDIGATPGDFYPEPLRDEIDALNDFIYPNINNGVYRAGFATTQDAYEEAVQDVFAALDKLEQRLAERRYLAGSTMTEADWRLFTTLVRFDALPPWCASTPSTSGISNAMCAASWTTRTSGATCATCINSPASVRP